MNRLSTGARRSRRLAAAVLAIVCVTAVVAGAGLGKTARATAPRSTAVSGTITLAHWASSTVETQLLRQVLNAFKKKYPQIKVNELVLDPYPTQMLARFAARKSPDVFYVDSNVFPDWLHQKLLEPLNAYVKRNHFSTKPFFPRLLSAFKQGKTIYGFPKDWSPLAMEINSSMLAKVNGKAPTTWAQLRALAVKMKNANAVPGGRPLCLDPDWARLLAFVYQNKGSFLNSAKTKATVNTGAVRDAVNFYVGMIKDGLAGTHDQLGVGWCGEALGKQKAGIIFEGNWLLPYMQETFSGVGYKTYVLPKGKTRGNLGFTVSYSMSRFSKNKPAAWTLLSFLTGKQGMKIWTSKGLALPSRSDVKAVSGRGALLKQAGYSHPWQFAPGFADVMTVAGNELQSVIKGSESVSTMLQKIQSAAQQALAGG
jgi:multiple sugar transport system substrate-binding protein